jgi:Fe-S oxidoreductase
MVRLLGKVFGLAPDVAFPEIARRSFRCTPTAKRLQVHRDYGGKDVILWTDTFNNGFTPAVLRAAVEVVESAGFHPRLMSRHICCGRPFYDAGLLDQAKRSLLYILDELSEPLEAGIPVLVLEPSCLSVFRDEMPALLADDPRAGRLAKLTRTMAEFALSAGLHLPESVQTHVHAHCHHRACGGAAAEKQLGAKVLDTGCCGMAGAFGYHAKTADVARRVGETELLPKLATVPAGAELVADGFSCRTQISKLSGRRALHLAELLATECTSQDHHDAPFAPSITTEEVLPL